MDIIYSGDNLVEYSVDGEVWSYTAEGLLGIYYTSTFLPEDHHKYPYAYWAAENDKIASIINATWDWYFCRECLTLVPPEHRHRGEKHG
jgi:hypothetical protein